ncbi:DHH family phosphoesterase [Peptostreptococcus faecalis]|uniref:DHH family phosphoesterase n=1 Tax=Peptostreptococcus faecalis TaxID=2045015 RepID=UPI000C7BD6EE|nr:bifunctional oligoribonuclease/PAP phosphatase NrnA [Peptostreptococcus faecalis]
MINIKEINDILDFIEKNDNYIVTSHENPDGDNIGSSLAMFRFLEKLGKRVSYVLDDEYPNNLMFLYEKEIKKKSYQVNDRNQVIIALDAGDYTRLNIDIDILEKSRGIICVDHHVTNGEYGFLKFIDSDMSSTSEMVYEIISEYENRHEVKLIDEKIATALYTGLITDTGNFQYSNTCPSSFLMASNLIERGADKITIIENIYQNNSLNFYKLLGETLENLEVIDDKISIATVTKEMIDRNSLKYDDIDPITPYTRDIEGVELGIFIKEKQMGEIKVSFRSKRYVDCTKLAKEFGGGGHVRASGCTIKDVDTKIARMMILEKAEKYI